MKIAIISDTHDNLANLEKFLLIAKREKIEGIIHCGDVTTPETLEWLAEKFEGPFKVVCGNMEIRREEFAEMASRHKNLEVFPEIGEWEISRGVLDKNVSHLVVNVVKIAFVHKPDKTEELALSGQYSFVFYGHTHKPWVRMVGATLVVNPGTLGGVFTAPTCATLDTKTGQLALHRL
ncbi:MAG TPA: metallophosphoesterase family protein [Candidatus Paceibacterota bacterium]|nr:metallophosphoesterase family protein [Candidatus Paceibacterota bacterium]